jgi:hypothetical protein
MDDERLEGGKLQNNNRQNSRVVNGPFDGLQTSRRSSGNWSLKNNVVKWAIWISLASSRFSPDSMVSDFLRGLAAVMFTEGDAQKWGSSTRPVIVIEPQFDGATDFSRAGCGGIFAGDAVRYGYIDKTARVIKPQFEWPRVFRGAAAVGSGDLFGYIDEPPPLSSHGA